MINKYAKYDDFFLDHLYDQVMQKYGLDDSQMSKLLALLGKVSDEDLKKQLQGLRKKENKKAIESLIQQQIQEDSRREFSLDHSNVQNSFVAPIGIPLTKDMIIQPYILYED